MSSSLKTILAGAAVAVMAVGFAGGANAQSAKFAATWDTDPVSVTAESICVDGVCDGLVAVYDDESEMATIHVGSKKSILIGVSAAIGIHMITEAKGGKNGDGTYTSSAMTEGTVGVTLSLTDVSDPSNVCNIAPNDNVVLKSEMRKLTVSADSTADEIEVFVGIETKSQSANSFQFLGVECEQGTYRMDAVFDLAAIAEAAGLDSRAWVMTTLGDRMITLQEVRAVKGSLVSDGD